MAGPGIRSIIAMPFARFASTGGVHRLRRVIGRYRREAATTLTARRMSDDAPRVAFLSFMGPKGSSLLRMYDIAEDCTRAGWQCVVIPPDLAQPQRDRILARTRPDLLILQSTRHPLNRREAFPKVPYILDIDDADFYLEHYAEPLANLAAGAAGVVAGSRYIAAWARLRNPNVEIVWTGASVSRSSRHLTPHDERPCVVCWAQTAPFNYGRELRFVGEVVEAVLEQGRQDITFRFYDIRPCDLARLPAIFRDSRVTVQCLPMMDYKEFIASLDDVSVGLCPLQMESSFSRGKSFGKILAYLEAKVPVLCNDAADHSLFFSPASGSLRETAEEFARGIGELLDDPALRQRMADMAHDSFLEKLSTAKAASDVRAFASRLVPTLARSAEAVE